MATEGQYWSSIEKRRFYIDSWYEKKEKFCSKCFPIQNSNAESAKLNFLMMHFEGICPYVISEKYFTTFISMDKSFSYRCSHFFKSVFIGYIRPLQRLLRLSTLLTKILVILHTWIYLSFFKSQFLIWYRIESFHLNMQIWGRLTLINR